MWLKQYLTPEKEWHSVPDHKHVVHPQEVLNHSDHHPVLFLSNLVEGTYTFHLKVTDAKGESDTERTTIEVKPGKLTDPAQPLRPPP